MMKFLLKILLLFICYLFSLNTLTAKISLPALVDDNMVLQRDANIKLWGWAEKGEKIIIQFQNKEWTTVTRANGKWEVELSPMPAGGPFEMIIKGENEQIILKNILLGDVWLFSGPSYLSEKWKTNQRNKTQSDFTEVRQFIVSQDFAYSPQKDVHTTGWGMSSSKSGSGSLSVAHLFGQELYQLYRIPVGLIISTWEGTLTEGWISENGIKKFPQMAQQIQGKGQYASVEYRKRRSQVPGNRQSDSHSKGQAELFMLETPTLLYNSMIAPLVPFSLTGVIWCQGEVEDIREDAKKYDIFPALIKDWRRQWGYDFPFILTQFSQIRNERYASGSYLRTYQEIVHERIAHLPQTGIVSTIDLDILNYDQAPQHMAHRLALIARDISYQENIVSSGPTFHKMTPEGNKLRISFDQLGSGLWINDKYGYIQGFSIAGEDQRFVLAKGYQDGDDIILYADGIHQPIAVRYNWKETPDGNVYNQEKLPVLPFKTDDW